MMKQAVTPDGDEQSSQVAVIREAPADYQAGSATLVPHEDVVKRLDAKIAEKLGVSH